MFIYLLSNFMMKIFCISNWPDWIRWNPDPQYWPQIGVTAALPMLLYVTDM